MIKKPIFLIFSSIGVIALAGILFLANHDIPAPQQKIEKVINIPVTTGKL